MALFSRRRASSSVRDGAGGPAALTATALCSSAFHSTSTATATGSDPSGSWRKRRNTEMQTPMPPQRTNAPAAS